MDAAIDFIVKKMIGTVKELFEDEDEFLDFKRDADSGSRCGTNSKSVSGRIVYRRRGELLFSPTLFLKISADVNSFPTANLAFHMNEIYFYSKVRPFFEALRQVDELLPKFYISHLDVSNELTNEILVLNDLEPDGFAGCRLKSTFLDYSHLALMMRKLGEFHAYSYKARLSGNEEFLLIMKTFKDLFSIIVKELSSRIEMRWKMACEPLRRDPKYAEPVRHFDRILSNFEEYLNQSLVVSDDEGTSVLCHCSYSKNNVLFRYAGERPANVVIVDWQTCRMNLAGVDILLALYTDANQETRDEHWDRLLEEYHRSLSQTFPEIQVPSVDEMMQNVKMKLGLVLLVVGSRIPHQCFSAYGKIKFRKTESFDEYADDPLTDVLKDMMDRKLLE